MPRAKLEMKRIEDPKKRKATFKNRRDGLVQKTSQLATLCGIKDNCFLICYDTKAAETGHDGGGAAVTTWPPGREGVLKVVEKYREMPADRFRQALKSLTFYQEEMKKQQCKFLKVQQCGAGKLGPWDSKLDKASAADLNALLGTLDETFQRVQRRMVALGGHVRDDMIVPVSTAAFAAPMPHAISLPDSGFNFSSSSFPDTGSMVTQFYDLPHGMLAQPSPVQPPCLRYQMLLPYPGYQMPPPYHTIPMPPPKLVGPPELGTTGYTMNVVNRSEFYDDHMQDFDAGGDLYVSNEVLGQAFATGPADAGCHLANHGTGSICPFGGTLNNPMDFSAFQLNNDLAGPSGSCSSSTSFQGGFQN